MRILIPDHPELAGVVSGAVEFAGVLCHANDQPADPAADPWLLPEQLTDPKLEQGTDHDRARRADARPSPHAADPAVSTMPWRAAGVARLLEFRLHTDEPVTIHLLPA